MTFECSKKSFFVTMSSLRSVSEWSTFTEDMRQESIKSLSLFLMLQYLEEKHTSEKPSDFHTMFLNILTEYCNDCEGPGDSLVFVKMLTLLVLIQQSREDQDENDSIETIDNVYRTLLQLWQCSDELGPHVKHLNKLLAEAQCQIILSHLKASDPESALSYWKAFYERSCLPRSVKEMSSQLKHIIVSDTADSSSEEMKLSMELFYSQHSTGEFCQKVKELVSLSVRKLLKRSSTYEYNKDLISRDIDIENLTLENQLQSLQITSSIDGSTAGIHTSYPEESQEVQVHLERKADAVMEGEDQEDKEGKEVDTTVIEKGEDKEMITEEGNEVDNDRGRRTRPDKGDKEGEKQNPEPVGTKGEGGVEERRGDVSSGEQGGGGMEEVEEVHGKRGGGKRENETRVNRHRERSNKGNKANATSSRGYHDMDSDDTNDFVLDLRSRAKKRKDKKRKNTPPHLPPVTHQRMELRRGKGGALDTGPPASKKPAKPNPPDENCVECLKYKRLDMKKDNPSSKLRRRPGEGFSLNVQRALADESDGAKKKVNLHKKVSVEISEPKQRSITDQSKLTVLRPDEREITIIIEEPSQEQDRIASSLDGGDEDKATGGPGGGDGDKATGGPGGGDGDKATGGPGGGDGIMELHPKVTLNKFYGKKTGDEGRGVIKRKDKASLDVQEESESSDGMRHSARITRSKKAAQESSEKAGSSESTKRPVKIAEPKAPGNPQKESLKKAESSDSSPRHPRRMPRSKNIQEEGPPEKLVSGDGIVSGDGSTRYALRANRSKPPDAVQNKPSDSVPHEPLGTLSATTKAPVRRVLPPGKECVGLEVEVKSTQMLRLSSGEGSSVLIGPKSSFHRPLNQEIICRRPSPSVQSHKENFRTPSSGNKHSNIEGGSSDALKSPTSSVLLKRSTRNKLSTEENCGASSSNPSPHLLSDGLKERRLRSTRNKGKFRASKSPRKKPPPHSEISSDEFTSRKRQPERISSKRVRLDYVEDEEEEENLRSPRKKQSAHEDISRDEFTSRRRRNGTAEGKQYGSSPSKLSEGEDWRGAADFDHPMQRRTPRSNHGGERGESDDDQLSSGSWPKISSVQSELKSSLKGQSEDDEISSDAVQIGRVSSVQSGYIRSERRELRSPDEEDVWKRMYRKARFGGKTFRRAHSGDTVEGASRNNESRSRKNKIGGDMFDFDESEDLVHTPPTRLPGRLPTLSIKSLSTFAPEKQAGPSHTRPCPSSPSKQRKAFSFDETEYLIRGIRDFGFGKWRQILDAFPFHSSRTSTSLKDKARNLKGRKK